MGQGGQWSATASTGCECNSGPREMWWWLVPESAMSSYHGGDWKTGSV